MPHAPYIYDHTPLRYRDRFWFRVDWPCKDQISKIYSLVLVLNSIEWQGCPAGTVFLDNVKIFAPTRLDPRYALLEFRNLFQPSESTIVADYNNYELGEETIKE